MYLQGGAKKISEGNKHINPINLAKKVIKVKTSIGSQIKPKSKCSVAQAPTDGNCMSSKYPFIRTLKSGEKCCYSKPDPKSKGIHKAGNKVYYNGKSLMYKKLDEIKRIARALGKSNKGTKKNILYIL